MKICFFADARNNHLQRVAMSLASRGHRVHIVSHKPVDIPDVSVERFSVPSPGLSHPFRWSGRLDRYLRSFPRQFDVVVLMFLSDWGFDPAMMTEGCFVAYPQGSDIVPPPGENPPPTDLVAKRREWLQSVTMVGAFCRRFARIISTFAGIDDRRFGALPIGVDLEKFRPGSNRGATRSRPLRIGYLKGFREVYGPTVLVEAIPRVLEEFPNAMFEFVGDGPRLAACKQMVASLGVGPSVTWIPRREHDGVPQLLSRWDLSVMPSRFESFGVAALESAAMGVPVIASNVGGLPDTVCDGETGRLVPPGSSIALADAIVALLHDTELRQRMGQAGRAWVEKHYGWPRTVEQWEKTLQEATERASVMV